MTLKTMVAFVVWLCLTGVLMDAQAKPRTGYVLINAGTGERLAAEAERQPFMPASTLKLVTTLSALDHLGPDHRFDTTLSISGRLADRVLEGDVVLHGQGDVELDLDDLMQMALALRQSGVEEVAGRFIIVDSAFRRFNQINAEQPPDAPYNAGVGPLSLAFGRSTIRPDGQEGYFASPQLPPGDPAWQLLTADTFTSAFKGKQRARAIPIHDVGMHAGYSLRRIAGELGVKLPIPRRANPPAGLRELLTIQSKPMAEMIEGMLVYSNNQLAETIGLATSEILDLDPQSLAESASGLWSELTPRLPETDWRGFQISNHSGLDPDARATPLQLASLLKYGLERHHLPHMLPANAWSGSLSRRLVEPDHLQRVWAKTGSVDFAAALAGYVLPEGGGLWIFVILSDDPQRRKVYDEMTVPSDAILAEARRWDVTIKSRQDRLLRRWISGRY